MKKAKIRNDDGLATGASCVVVANAHLCGGPATGGIWHEHGARLPHQGEAATHRVTRCYTSHDFITDQTFHYVEVEPI